MNRRASQTLPSKTLFPLLASLLSLLAWVPTLLNLSRPSADQVWEWFGTEAICQPDRFQLGWVGSATDVSFGAFTASLPASAVGNLSCQLALHSLLNPLQAYLVLGLLLTFSLAALSTRLGGFRSDTCLLVAFLITTAPCAFSRVGHLSLATLWPVVPALMACHGLWRILFSDGTTWPRTMAAGALAALLCWPSQDYYAFFMVLQLLATFGLLLFLATTHTSALRTLGALVRRGLHYGTGFLGVLVLAFLPKLQATGASGPPAAWATPRYAIEQFQYGLLPFTWLIPSPWIPMVRQQLVVSGIPPTTESFFWSAGSFLIPIAWAVAIWVLARQRDRSVPDDGSRSLLPIEQKSACHGERRP
jgi:hypothetical protein